MYFIKRFLRVSAAIVIVGASALAPGAEKPMDAKKESRPAMIVATDYDSLYEAVEAARRLEAYRVYIPPGIYDIEKTLNLTMLSWSPVYRQKEGGEKKMIPRNTSMILEGAGRSTILVAQTGDSPVIDLSGSMDVTLRDFVIQSPYETDPEKGNRWVSGSSVGILMARVRLKSGARPSAGNHVFENVRVHGAFDIASAVCWDSEVNRFYSCVFRNDGAGDAFILTGQNKEGIKSPYVRNGNSTQVECRFYGTGFMANGTGSVGLRIANFSDVSIHGGFVGTRSRSGSKPFAGIYLDGTRSLGNITVRDVRMECAVGHSLYAVGAVENVIFQGGEWVSGEVSTIRHEEMIPSTSGAHKYVTDPAGSGRATNWIVENIRFARRFEGDPALERDTASVAPEAMLRFDSLQDSRFSHLNFYARRKQEGQNNWKGDLDVVTPRVVVDKYSRRNTFEVPSREAVRLTGDARGNSVVALCDGDADRVPALWQSGEPMTGTKKQLFKSYDSGTRRTYVNPDDGGSLFNMGIQNVHEIERPRRGDVALHDGSGFDDGLIRQAVYDGERWVFFPPALPDSQ